MAGSPRHLIAEALSEAAAVRKSVGLSPAHGRVNLLIHRVETIRWGVYAALEVGPRIRVESRRLLHQMLLPDAVDVCHISDIQVIPIAIHGPIQELAGARR
jgi:hypothetical protein